MQTKHPPIGLVGLARAGKDTTADLLTHYGYRRVAFADRLKRAALDIDPIVQVSQAVYATPVTFRLSEILDRHDGDWDTAKGYEEVRRFLQHLGVSIRDHVDRDSWTHAAAKDVHRIIDNGRTPVFTDVRFSNEVDLVRSFGGLIVRIERPGAGLTGTAGQHASEDLARSIEADHLIVNDGSLSDLAAEVRDLIEHISRHEVLSA